MPFLPDPPPRPPKLPPPPSSIHHHRRHHRALRFPTAPTITKHKHLTLLHQSHLLSRLPALSHLPAPDISTLPHFSHLHAAAAAAAADTNTDDGAPDAAALPATPRGAGLPVARAVRTPLGRDGGVGGVAPAAPWRTGTRTGTRVLGARARRLTYTAGGSPVRVAGAGAGAGAGSGVLVGDGEGEEVYRGVWGRRTRGQRELWRRGEGYMLASREWVGVRLAWEEDGAGGAGEVGDGMEFAKRGLEERRERLVWEDDEKQVRKKMGRWWIADCKPGDEAGEAAKKSDGEPVGEEKVDGSGDRTGADSGAAVDAAVDDVLPPRKKEASWPDMRNQFFGDWNTQASTAWRAAAASPTTPAKAGNRSMSENWEAYPHTPSGGTESEYELNESYKGALLSPFMSDVDSLEHNDRDNGKGEEEHESPLSSPKHDRQQQPSNGDTAATQLRKGQTHGHDFGSFDSTLKTIVRKNRFGRQKQRRHTLDPSPNQTAAMTSTKHFKKTDGTAVATAISPTIQAIRVGELPLSDSFQINICDDGQADPFTETEAVEDGPDCSMDEMDKLLTSVWDAYACGNEYSRGRLVSCLRDALDEQARLGLDTLG